MSWQELQPANNAAAKKAPVRVGVWQKGDGDARLMITVKREVLEKIGPIGLYKIMIGAAEDKHGLRIEAGGQFKPTELGKAKGGGYFRFMLPPLKATPECSVEPQEVKFTAGAKTIVIDLPAWAWDERVKIDVERAAGVRR